MGPFVETTIPSVTPVAHAGRGLAAPSTSTTHIRQPPKGSSFESWQRVGMKVPCRAAAWTRSSPSGALTLWPSSVNSTIAVTLPRPLEGREELRPDAHRVSHRHRRRLPEPADGRLLHRLEPLVHLLPRHRGMPVLELPAEVVERAVPDPARRALLARLLGEEAHRLAQEAERRVRRREDLHRGRARAGAPLAQPLAREGSVERGRREDPARRASG